jgi:hypothetical protein
MRFLIRRLDLIGMLVPTGLAAGLVLYDLGSRSLWLDEGVTFTTASQHGSRLVHAALGDGGNMLSYYLSLHYWMTLFGSSEFAMRMPTALAAIGTIPVCFYLLKRLIDLRAAVFGSFFVAVSVPFVWYAQQARAYEVAIFLVCCSMLAFVVAIQTRHLIAWAAYVVPTVLAAYTIELSALVVVAQAASLFLLRRRELQWRAMLASAGGIGLLVIPLALMVAHHGFNAIQWLPAPGPVFSQPNRYLVDFLASSRANGVPVTNSLVQGVTVLTVLCWALGAGFFVHGLLRRGRGEREWGYGLLIGWFVLPPMLTYVVSIEIHPVLGDRYILAALPPASMLAGVALSRLRPWWIAAAGGLTLVALRAWAIAPGYGVSLENWRQGVIAVAARSHPHDCIAFFVADGYTTFDYYVLHLTSLPGPVPTLVLPDVSWQSRTRYTLDPEYIAPSRMARVVATCPRLWLVSSHTLGYPPGPGVLPYRARVYEANRALSSELSASYRETSALTFVGANVSLYVRTGSRRQASTKVESSAIRPRRQVNGPRCGGRTAEARLCGPSSGRLVSAHTTRFGTVSGFVARTHAEDDPERWERAGTDWLLTDVGPRQPDGGVRPMQPLATITATIEDLSR